MNQNYKKIQGLPLSALQPMILGKNIEMIATCDLFPNFHVNGIVYKIEQPSNICIIYVKEKNRIVKVDGGMNGCLSINFTNIHYSMFHSLLLLLLVLLLSLYPIYAYLMVSRMA